VILDGKGGPFFAGNALNRIIIKVQVCELNGFIVKRIHIDTEAVVLTGYLNLSRPEILYGMIRPSVPEFELVCFGTESQCKKLMAETNPEDWHFAEESF